MKQQPETLGEALSQGLKSQMKQVRRLSRQLQRQQAQQAKHRSQARQTAHPAQHQSAQPTQPPQYQQVQPIEQLLPTLLTPATEWKRENLWQIKDIQKELEQHLRTSDVPTLKALAAIVKKLKWPRGGSHGVEGYYLQRQG